MFLQRSDVIALNGFNANVWTGTQFEYAPVTSFVEIAVMSSVTPGVNTTIILGTDTLCIDQVTTVVRAAGQFGIYPDDYVYQDVVMAGQRIVEQLRGVAAATGFSSIKMTPL